MLSLLMTVLGVASLAMALLYFGQNRLLYPAPNFEVPKALPATVSRQDFKHGYGFLLQPPATNKEPTPLIIFAHGNGELAYFWIEEFQTIAQQGFSVLLLEYPGYGGAPGRTDKPSIERAILAAYDELAPRSDIDATRIVAYGRSIGGGAATFLAEQRKVAALCLESTFSSLAALVAEKGLPAMLLRDRYDNEKIVRDLSIPVFLYHGTEDTLIPLHHSQALQRAGKDARLHTQRCGHNDCPRPWTELLAFLKQTL